MNEIMEYKSFEAEFQVKADDSEGMTFEGYASTFGNVDEGKDVIQKGAFKRTINNRFKKGKGSLIKVLRGHWDLIGIPIAMQEDSHGLFTESKVSRTPLGEETMMLIRDEALDRLSIGFRAIKTSKDEETGIRTLKEIKLFEYSVVDFAMNEMAQITASKALAMLEDNQVRSALTHIAEEKFKELLKDFDPSVAINNIVGDATGDVIIPEAFNTDQLQKAIHALRDTATALEESLLIDPSADTPSKENGIDDIDPAVLHSMLEQMQDINKTYLQV